MGRSAAREGILVLLLAICSTCTDPLNKGLKHDVDNGGGSSATPGMLLYSKLTDLE